MEDRRLEKPTLLRVMTCGSVDDGKSTLIGRLLYESGAVFDDHLSALRSDSMRWGTQGIDLDFALLLDGLAAEREQGITIDVAYRQFSTSRRRFIIADTPGHEQYTRNTITGASVSDVAVILVDATKGVLEQTRRHSYLASLLGLTTIALAVNKLDLVGYDEVQFRTIESAFLAFAASLEVEAVSCLPLSALRGDNVTTLSSRTPWYLGPTLLEYLEKVEIKVPTQEGPSRFPIQWINHASPGFRGASGTIARGTLRLGDHVQILPSGGESSVERIVTFDGDLEEANATQAVTLVLTEELDISRGDVIVDAQSPAEIAEQFESTILWMGDHELVPGRPYLAKLGTRTTGMAVGQIKSRVDTNTLQNVPAKTLRVNQIGICTVLFDRPVPFDPYRDCRDLGGFIIIDRLTSDTVGAGLIHFALRRARNVQWQAVDVNKGARAVAKHQKPMMIWLTGLSGSGKSTIANGIELELHARGLHTYLLDGDNVRHGLNRDLGFTEADRAENIRRVAEAGALMVDAGLVVVAAFISPFRAERQLVRDLFQTGEFCEVYVDAPLELAEARDPKGLYAKARRGELLNFTGIDSRYEPPELPEVHLDIAAMTPAEAVRMVLDKLDEMGLFRD